MASNPGDWTATTVNGRLVMECDVVVTSGDADGYTLKTPASKLDPTRPWILMVNTEPVTIEDSTAVAVDIWAGYDDDFALAGDGAVTVTSGCEVASAVIDNVKATCLSVIIDPNYKGTKVQTTLSGPLIGVCNCGMAPHYIINCDNAGTHDHTVTIHFVIIQ